MTWYNFTQKQKQVPTRRDYLAQAKYDKIVAARVRDFEEIIGVEITRGIQYRFVTMKNFNALPVLEWILQKYSVTEVFLAVYRMNQPSVETLKNLILNNNIECHILVSNFFRENKKYERWARELTLFGKNNNVKVTFARNHAKVFIAKTRCGKHIVFEGSGNLSDNARIEQYLLEDCPETYNFHREWIKEIANGTV